METIAEHRDRLAHNAAGEIRTYTGRYVKPLDMRAIDIDIEDIAHHLSNLCRYNGGCPKFYSVAHHSVLCADAARKAGASPELELACLLHDAGEAYFNDIVSPVKNDPRMQWYADLEHQTTKLIFCVYGISPALLETTKHFDNEVLQNELASWWGDPYIRIYPWTAGQSKRLFLARFNQLMAALKP